MLKNIMLSLAICLTLGASILDANDINKRIIIIDPQYLTTTDKLNCGKAKNIDIFISDIVNELVVRFEKNKDYNVVLTNVTETYVEDNKRSKIANNSSGDILISIAAFCPKGDKEENIEVVNSMIVFQKTSESTVSSKNVFSQEDILNDLKQDSLKKYNEGVILSRSIQKKITQEKININKEIKLEPVEVLIGANMPATLIRIPYLENISGDHDDRQFKNKIFIDRLVPSIYAGVNEFWGSAKRTGRPLVNQ